MKQFLSLFLILTTISFCSCSDKRKAYYGEPQFDSIVVSYWPGFTYVKTIRNLHIYPADSVVEYAHPLLQAIDGSDLTITPLPQKEATEISKLTKGLFLTRTYNDIENSSNSHTATDFSHIIINVYRENNTINYEYYLGHLGIKYSRQMKKFIKLISKMHN